MRQNFQAISLYGNTTPETIDGGGQKYAFRNETGTGSATVYSVFPGIDLIYNEIHMSYCSHHQQVSGRVIEINYCQQGRSECGFGNRTFGYMGPGDLAFCTLQRISHEASFPLYHYHGITITVDFDQVTKETEALFDSLFIDLTQIGKLFDKRDFFILRANERIEHIFSELYAIDDAKREGYLKLKTLELLLVLTYFNPGMERRKYLSKSQTDLVRNVQAQMTDNPKHHFTIDELAKAHGVSPTHLKNCFRCVYGTSIYAYMRVYRLHLAARLLTNTDKQVAEIASLIGFENPNKFSSAFRSEFGISPTQFRKSV